MNLNDKILAGALFDNAAVGVAVVTDAGIVERCNSRLERLIGSGHGTLVGRRMPLFHAPALCGCEGAHSAEKHLVRDDGSELWLRGTGHHLAAATGSPRALWIVEEVTERERARAAARRSRRRLAEATMHIKHSALRLHDELAKWRADEQRDLVFEDRLRAAVEQSRFELHYQPLVDLCRMDVCGLEALLRWRTDDGEWIPPSHFIPVAESSGLIVSLGRWTFLEACRQMCAWRDAGHRPVPMAVNLSPREFGQPEFVHSILGTLDAARIDPRLIEFEITESTLVENMDDALAKMHALAASGVGLAVDDFGTGYSSLSYLRELPVCKLKIDQSFVRSIVHDRKVETIVAGIIQLAKNLGLTTVAEGVETAEQLDILRRLGCDQCQGYYFARPAPAAALPMLLAGSPVRQPLSVGMGQLVQPS
ncbi:EAL domain-containing protein [Aquincola sp. S2]|uniref:EAL domain-containing protein n=2 Tax=Pseudaquabacterium terrae TaxID=2732868 RepID=A0ABX2EIQ4_9BURK|nr:EAL domain-containing protein [Aquabacterium terrae]